MRATGKCWKACVLQRADGAERRTWETRMISRKQDSKSKRLKVLLNLLHMNWKQRTWPYRCCTSATCLGLNQVINTMFATSKSPATSHLKAGGNVTMLSPPCSMAQLAYFAPNKVFEPHLIAAALLSFKISTIRHATTTAIYSNSFEI
jgi:hypothetical protein